jgi:hypothetical protein
MWHNGILFSHKEEWNCVIYRKMDGTGEHHVKWNKPASQRQVSDVFSHMWNVWEIKKDIKVNVALKGKGGVGEG